MRRHLLTSLLPVAFASVLVAMVVASGAPLASASPYSSAHQSHAGVAFQRPKQSHAVNPLSCVYYGTEEANPTVFGAHISIAGVLYNCSGNYVLDSLKWTWNSGPGIVLQNWWLYQHCGDFSSEKSGSPNAYLGYGSTTYTTYPGASVSNIGYDVDSKFAYGGNSTQISECL